MTGCPLTRCGAQEAVMQKMKTQRKAQQSSRTTPTLALRLERHGLDGEQLTRKQAGKGCTFILILAEYSGKGRMRKLRLGHFTHLPTALQQARLFAQLGGVEFVEAVKP
jgi:hypothetical protein